jgi:hypothetical protein
MVLVLLLVTGGVLAAFLWNKQVPSTVKISGVSGAEAYSNADCTTPLTALDFGAIKPGQTTNPVAFWVKNGSDAGGPSIYVALSQTGLNSLLALYQGTGNVIPVDPSRLKLATGSNYVAGYWQAGTPSTTILTAINNSVNIVEVASISGFAGTGKLYCEGEVIAYIGLRAYVAPVVGSWTASTPITNLATALGLADTEVVPNSATGFPATSGTIKIDNELISYGYKNGPGTQFFDCIRGFAGTIAAVHSVGATITNMTWTAGSPEVKAAFTGCARGSDLTTAASHAVSVAIANAQWVGEVGGALYSLAPGGILPVSVYLVANSAIPWADYPFTLIIEGKDTPY